DPLEQIALEWIELAGPRLTRPVPRLATSQVLANRVTRQPRLSHDLPNRATLSFQNPNLHRLLLGQHLDGSKSRHPRPGGSFLLRRGWVIFTSAVTVRPLDSMHATLEAHSALNSKLVTQVWAAPV